MREDSKRVMVFSPHPDDDVIGCGGSILKHVELGNYVTVVYMTSGDASSLENKKELAQTREQEAVKAAGVLRVKDHVFLGRPDGYLENNKGLLISLVDLIRNRRPNIIYVPHGNDSHLDHKVTFDTVTEAAGRAATPFFQECKDQPWDVETILAYEIWTPLESFSYVENITSQMDRKIEALQQHRSQLKHFRYDEAFRGLNRYRGVMTGKGDYCEVFSVVKAGGSLLR